VTALIVVVGVLAGCGGHSSSAAHVSPYCKRQAALVADAAHTFVHSFTPGFGIGSVQDVPYFGLRTVLGGFTGKCPPSSLRDALAHRLTPAQRRSLLVHLPASKAAYFRTVLRTSQG
jgi:hypothetical protein